MKHRLTKLFFASLLGSMLLVSCGPTPHTHDFSSLIDRVEPTCLEPGMKAHYECSCGKFFDENKNEVDEERLIIAAPGRHSYRDAVYTITLETHSIKCTKCEHIDTGVHSLTKYDRVEATCSKKGTEAHFKCSDCGAIINETKTALVNKLSDLDIPAKEHNKGSLIAKTNPTCDNDGMEAHYVCVNCGQFFDESGTECTEASLKIEKLHHDYEGSDTDFDINYHWKTCQREGCEYQDKIAHDFKRIEQKNPTCTGKGMKEHYICNDCGAVVNSTKTKLINDLSELDIDPTGHKPDTSKWFFNATSHWHKCLNDGCNEKLDFEPHTSTGYTNVVNTTSTKAGSFSLDCSVCEGNHTHNYSETPTINHSNDYSQAMFTFTCDSCEEGAPDHTFVQTVNTTKTTIEKGRITPGGFRYSATTIFLGKEYSDSWDDVGEPYGWVPGSSGSDVAEIDRDLTTNNVILNAVLRDGDTTFAIDPGFIALYNKVNASMVQISFKILSLNDNTGLWYTNQIDGYSGKEANQLTVGSVVTIFAKVGTPIIFRNGLKVEVESVYFIDPYLLLNENSTRTDYFGLYYSTRDTNGLIDNFEYNTDGLNDFCLKTGLSAEYVGKLYNDGYRTISFDLTRTGGDLTRLIVMEGQTKHETYPANGKVTVSLYGAYPIYIDVCGDGGVLAKGSIKMNNITYGTELDGLSLKVISSQSLFESYIHHDFWGEDAPTEQPFGASKYGSYVVIKGCADIQANKLFTEAQQLGARYMIFEADVAAGQGETDVPVQIVAIHGGGAFETPLNTIIENGHVSIKIDLKSYLFDIDGDFKLGLCFRIARNDKVYEGAAAGFKDSADAMNNAWFKVYAPKFLTE